jgi:hypothetical protein
MAIKKKVGNKNQWLHKYRYEFPDSPYMYETKEYFKNESDAKKNIRQKNSISRLPSGFKIRAIS